MVVESALVSRTAGFFAKTSGEEETHLGNMSNEILERVAKQKLPPIARNFWFGPKRWDADRIKVDNRIRSQFRAGDNSTAMRKTFLDRQRTKYKDHQIRYTDGSKSRAGVGLGVYGENESLSSSKKLATICSSFSAEVAGILEGVIHPSDRPLLIVTDSASTLDALTTERPIHPWIQAICKHIRRGTVLTWVPGHCGIPGNEAADRLASSGHLGVSMTKEVPLGDVRKWIRNIFNKKWEEEWFGNEQPFLRKIKGSTKRFEDLQLLKEQRVLSRLRTGHCRLSHRYDGGEFHVTCDTCRLRNTVEHVLCTCPKYEHLRELYGISESVRDVLGDDPARAAALFCFLKDAELFHEI